MLEQNAMSSTLQHVVMSVRRAQAFCGTVGQGTVLSTSPFFYTMEPFTSYETSSMLRLHELWSQLESVDCRSQLYEERTQPKVVVLSRWMLSRD